MQFVTESVRHQLRFCDIISNHWFPPQQPNHRLYSVYSFVPFVHFETDWSQRDPQVAQCVQFCKVWTFWNWSDWSKRDQQVVQCVQLYSLKLIGNKGTNSIVSDLVNILKMIGLEGTLRFVQCVQFCTVYSISFSSISVSHTKHRLLEIQKHL